MQIPDKPLMTDAEIALFKKYAPKGGRVLEFGSGGSTRLFWTLGVSSLVSVESDLAWLEALARAPEVFKAHKEGTWNPIHANIGDTSAWGSPTEQTLPQVGWLGYHQQCWDFMPDKHFDFILVDGRFRVACILQSFIHCTNADAVIFAHDFWNRPFYHVVLDFVDVLDKADSAAVFRRRASLDWPALCKTLQRHSFMFI